MPPFSQLVERDAAAEQHRGVSRANVRDIGDIDHHLVHTDEPQHLCAAAVDLDFTSAGQRPGIAVDIADRERRDPRFTRQRRFVVANALPCRDSRHTLDPRTEAADRLPALEKLIGRRDVAVPERADAHRVVLPVRVPDQADGIQQVDHGEMPSRGFQRFHHFGKKLVLCARLLPVPECQVTVYAFVDNAFLLHGGQQVGHVGKAEAMKPGIQLDMYDCRAIHELRGAAQCGQDLRTPDRHADARANAGLKLFRRGLTHAQHTDILRQSVDQFQGFRNGRHSKKAHAALVQRLPDPLRTVTVSIRLQHADHFNARLQQAVGFPVIRHQRAQVHLKPGTRFVFVTHFFAPNMNQ